jgi:MFS family permease
MSIVSNASPGATTLPADSREREPRGYTGLYWLASFGLLMAIFAPIAGGLSIKLQGMVGLEKAPELLGLVSGVGAFFALIGQPLAGRLSDRTRSRFGMRRPWIIIGSVGATISLFTLGLAPSVLVLIIAFCAAQFFTGVTQAGEAVTIADQVPSVRRGAVSGIVGTAAPVSILAAAIGLNFLPTEFSRFAVPALIGLAFALLFAFTLKDRVMDPSTPREPFGLRSFLGAFVFNPRTHKDFGWAWLSKALVMFAYAATATFLTLYVATDFGLKDIGAQLQFNLIAQLVSTFFLIIASVLGGRLSDRLRKRRVFVAWSGALVGLGTALIGVAALFFDGQPGLIAILVAEAVLGFGGGMFFAVDAALCVEVLPNANDAAKDLGVLNIANTLPQTLSPFLAGTVVIPLGNLLFPGTGFTVWFVFAGIVAVVGGILVFRIKKVA